ncbi:unnamed protein product [Spirodela intermedia]|uniref:Uncharacterized protein n=1 Tax=Spirodela intermedia TaxID=51605 RepID=A0ABN7EBZ4_SPIIN|nr:unnamed protein product [Spirodela intermedia]
MKLLTRAPPPSSSSSSSDSRQRAAKRAFEAVDTPRRSSRTLRISGIADAFANKLSYSRLLSEMSITSIDHFMHLVSWRFANLEKHLRT